MSEMWITGRRIPPSPDRVWSPSRLVSPQQSDRFGDLAAFGFDEVQQFFRSARVQHRFPVWVYGLEVVNGVLDLLGLAGGFPRLLRESLDLLFRGGERFLVARIGLLQLLDAL